MTIPPRPAPDPALERAMAAAQSGDLATALDHVERRIAAGISTDMRAPITRTLDELATRAESRGLPALSERALAMAVAVAPGYADLQRRHARALARLDRRPEARRALARALEINSGYVEARLDLALLDAREGRVGESLDALRRLVADTRVAEPLAYQRGVQCLERADWEQADSLLRRGLALERPEFLARLDETRDLLAHADAEGAVENARLLVEKHPAYPDSHALLGAAELQRGHIDDAMSALARALELHPGYHEARVLFARALEAQGAFSSAADQAALVLEVVPDHTEARAIHERWARRKSSRFTGS